MRLAICNDIVLLKAISYIYCVVSLKLDHKLHSTGIALLNTFQELNVGRILGQL